MNSQERYSKMENQNQQRPPSKIGLEEFTEATFSAITRALAIRSDRQGRPLGPIVFGYIGWPDWPWGPGVFQGGSVGTTFGVSSELREFAVERAETGEIVGAKGVTIDGSALHFTLEKGVVEEKRSAREARGKKSTFATLSCYQDGSNYLTLTASVSVELEQASFRAEGEGVQMQWTMDFSEYDSTHKASVSGRINSEEVSGTFDPRTNKATVALGLDYWLPEDSVRRLAYFTPTFEEVRAFYQAQGKPFEEIVNRTIQHSIWGTLGRAACWGIAGAGAAMACGATAGAGCVVAAGLWGAAASICSDAQPQ